jgi:2-iminobutanoate/2-iminopropanoate deaminase
MHAAFRRRNFKPEWRIPVQVNAKHKPVAGEGLPKPAGPYSPAVTLDKLVFVSGQGAKDPASGQLSSFDVESQTEQVFRNIETILKAAGSGLEYVVQCRVFLTDIRDFSKMNAAYERMLGKNRPARTTVQVAALPAPGLRVEIDATAYVP